MTELREEVFSGDFPAYRKKEIEIAASFVSISVIEQQGSEYVRGAMDMFRKILNIPKDVAKNDEQKQIIGQMLDRDFAQFQIEFLRKAVRTDEPYNNPADLE
jgi:hypothetical protein